MKRHGISRSFLALVLLAAMLCVGPTTGHGTSEPKMLKVALIVPRSPDSALKVAKYNKRLAGMTDGTVQIRVYWGGAAGDDVDVLRKMRAGQIDGAPLGLELLSNFVRQALVLQSPALFNNYRQVDAVRAALTPAMDAVSSSLAELKWREC